MFEGYLFDCKTKRAALKHALSIFGEDASRLFISQLEDKYKLIVDGGTPCSSVEDIDNAIMDIAGPSADLIISRMHSYLRTSGGTASSAATL